MSMLRYRVEGSGEPLLLVHGWGVTYTIWENLAPLLKPHFQLIMIELPGNGGSPEVDPDKPYYPACAEAIEEVRLALGIERWSVLAYSSGTRAAEAYLQRYPGSCVRAAFLCPIYLVEWWALALHILEDAGSDRLTGWFLSDWRLYGLVLALAFNGRRHVYTRSWKSEIELQPISSLARMLFEMPGKGRVPFELPSVPTLFVWGRRDVLTDRPRRLRPNDVVIPANHSAPVLAASNVAAVVLPFLKEGKMIGPPTVKTTRKLKPYERKRNSVKERTSMHLPGILRKASSRRFLHNPSTPPKRLKPILTRRSKTIKIEQ